ncbi:hypothetical protein KOW79_019490 [Hemibagrus wyckioides]|uniref:Apple domain-containing protein n=1 Tax=Hemibagrus wyckioides TaxID=337641 RepID=A0A9D3NA83_9TELE|nr:hypothetical protein KOW79_019490 [Hemibagrus wyckioides]
MRVYVLIVLWCVFPDSFSKAQELKVDVEFPGDDFLQIYSPDVQHCQLACTQHPSCLFLLRTDHREKDFFNGSRSVSNIIWKTFHCYLKRTATGSPFQVVAQTGVTSGFKLVHQDNKTAQELKVDVDFPGDDFLQIYSPDVQHCQLACTQHPSCLFFTFFRSDWVKDNKTFHCYLKRTATGSPFQVVAQTGVTSGFKLVHQDNKTAQELKVDVDFPGDDFLQIYSPDVQHCQLACTQHPSCLFFTFFRSDWVKDNKTFHCYLKRTATGSPFQVVAQTGVTSGFKLVHQDNKTAQELKVDVDFPGDDFLQIYSPDVQHCQLACTQHPSCLFFTFFRSDWVKDNKTFHCYLKRTATGSPFQVVAQTGVTSGFKLVHQDNKTDTCLSSTYQGIDFTGSDYVQLTLNTSDDCQKQCTSDPDCAFFSFTTKTFPDAESRNKCFLKFRWTVPTPSVLIKTPGLVSGFSDASYKTKEDCKEEIFANIHYRGNDIENIPAASPQHCQFLCNRHPRCTHFTYTTSSYSTKSEINMHCFLKHTQNVSQLKPVIEEKLFSGFPTQNCTPSNVWATARYEDLHFLGHDYHDFKTDSSELCRETCTKDPNCHFYTYALPCYHDENIRRGCYLKHVMALPIPEKVKHSHGVISGFSLRNCSESTAHPA